MAATWLTAFGIFALTVAATLWKRAADANRKRLTDEDDLIRFDSDKG
jgi:hypothetical protein